MVENGARPDAPPPAGLWLAGGGGAARGLSVRTCNALIVNLMDPEKLGIYSPAVQIDGGLLLLVTAVAAVLLPRTALVHAEGHIHHAALLHPRHTGHHGGADRGGDYRRAGVPLVFKVWLGDPSPDTCHILRLMLIHTVIGGSGAVGRSILLATGKVQTVYRRRADCRVYQRYLQLLPALFFPETWTGGDCFGNDHCRHRTVLTVAAVVCSAYVKGNGPTANKGIPGNRQP